MWRRIAIDAPLAVSEDYKLPWTAKSPLTRQGVRLLIVFRTVWDYPHIEGIDSMLRPLPIISDVVGVFVLDVVHLLWCIGTWECENKLKW